MDSSTYDKQKLKTLIAALALSSASTACADQPSIAPNTFVGRWSPDCANIQGFQIKEDDSALIEVNSNQIYVTAKIASKATDVISLSYVQPADLGAGGMRLQWTKFSRKMPIAKISRRARDQAELDWYGFYESTKKQFVWKSEPDFLGETSDTILYRCAD